MEKELSYEESYKKLQEIIEKIEIGNLPLDEAVKLFEEGGKLIQICYKSLDGAKGKLTEIKETIDSLEEVE